MRDERLFTFGLEIIPNCTLLLIGNMYHANTFYPFAFVNCADLRMIQKTIKRGRSFGVFGGNEFDKYKGEIGSNLLVDRQIQIK